MKRYSILTLCFCLCGCLSLQAKATDDLAHIKQNFFRLLVPNEKDTYHLKSILANLPPETEMSDQVVVELHQRYPFDKEKMALYLSSQTAEGTWPDINYQDRKRSGWEPKTHAERILELVKLYRSPQTDYHNSPQVEAAIHKALRYWFEAKLVCPNWWYNQIGIPKTLGTAFILFEDRLTEEEKQQAVEVMKNSRFGMTGQNKVWLAGNVLMRALLQHDEQLVAMARDTIASEIVTGRSEGIQEDWSFHQHGSQQQFGNYGLSFVSGMSFFSGVFSGTSLAFDSSKLDIICRLINEGYRWILWKGRMDISALGRQLFHHVQVHKALSLAFATAELGGNENPQTASMVRSLINENYMTSPTGNPLTGHRHFWTSDYTIHRAPQWMASVKMASKRVVGVECMNGDNMKGFYMADGATYIYQDGNEYLDIFPLWDWRKLPGVTAIQDDAPMPVIKGYKPGNNAWVAGGVSDGKEGLTAMQVNRAGITARKAWVFTNDFILCLGAGISSDSTGVSVATTIEQCNKRNELLAYSQGKWSPLKGLHTFNNSEEYRFYHNGKGYITWPGQHVWAECTSRSGQWHDVMQMYRPAPVEGEVVSLGIEHGEKPEQATYQYLILPATDPEKTADFDLSTIQILRNDTVAQIIALPETKQWWIAAYEPVKFNAGNNVQLELKTPGGYMLRQDGKGYTLWAADLSQQHEQVQLKLGKSEITIPLPKEKGKTIRVDLPL